MVFAQRMMNNAYKYKKIPESQYAWKYTQAIEAVVVKHFFQRNNNLQDAGSHDNERRLRMF